MLLKISFVFLFVLFSFYGYAQQGVSINTSGNPADSSAMLDVSSTSKGLLIPRVALNSINDITTIANPAVSLLVYNTNASMVGGAVGFWYFDGTIWVQALGPQGIQGLVGATGATGAIGPQGIQGEAGATGATGAAGTNGTNGAVGATGATGAAGTNGTNGAVGATGATGAAGTNGTNGAVGATGATGAAGTNGTNGAVGATGATGAAGTNGTNGAVGATGATGAAGTNGTNGAVGATGATGAAGTNGTNGAVGATGATGAAGTNGTNGAVGATGATGAAGTNGTNGAVGATGATGAAGTNGTNGAVGATGATGPVGCTTPNIVLKSDGTAATCSQIYDDGTNVGIGTTSPWSKLHVINTMTTNDDGALRGIQNNTDYYGIGGIFEGGYIGVRSSVYPTGSNYYFGSANYVGGGSGTNYASYNSAYGSGTNYGVYASASGGTTNWAGYFSGNVALTGALQANGSYGSTGQVLTSNGTGAAYWSTVSGGGVAGSGTTNYIPLWTPNGTTLGDSWFNQVNTNTMCFNGTYSSLTSTMSIYPVTSSARFAIFGSQLYGDATDGTSWNYFGGNPGGGVMGVNEAAGQYKAGVLGVNWGNYGSYSENTGGVVGVNNDQTYFGGLSYYKNSQWYAGWFDGEVDVTSNIDSRNTLEVSGAVVSPQSIGKFTNNYSGYSDSYAVYGYSRPMDYWGIGGYFEGGYYGVNGVVQPTGSNFYYGTLGTVSGGSGNNYGLYGYAYGSGTNYGVYGYAGGGSTNWAGYFSGNVALTGALQANGSLGTAGQVLTSNGTGAAYWATPSGGGTNYWTNSGSYIYPNTPSANTNIQFWPSTSTSYQMYITHTSTDRYGLSVYEGSYTAGSGYGTGSSRACIEAHDFDGSNYEFGIAGYNYNDYERSGGVIGAQWNAGYWGALGYKNSSGTSYGGYFTSYTTGTGFMPDNNSAIGIGSGSYGGIMGSWSRGEVFGFTSAGELYASYNLGNEYTSGVSADIVTLENKRVAVYSVTSNDIKVYADGSGQLVNGKCNIQFERTFSEVISEEMKPSVTVTANGECNGLFTVEISSNGFTVKELNNGNSNVEFTWIAIGKRVDADKLNKLPEVLTGKDFDANMKGVMFNENNTDNAGKPIWWDGNKIRFDKEPEIKTDKKEEIRKQDGAVKSGLLNLNY